MKIGGWQKTTMIDYPGRVATTVFTVGCNFRCPFCHNRELSKEKMFADSHWDEINVEEIWKFLEKRKGILDGVCITGGEPTLQPDLKEFCQKIKDMGYLVKVDSNGSNPSVLKDLMASKVVDMVSMDLKNSFEKYEAANGVKMDIERIKLSAQMIKASGLEYEFRTTVVPGIHTIADLEKLAEEINILLGKDTIWYLQDFQPNNCLDLSLMSKHGWGKEKLETIAKRLSVWVEGVKVRK